uniref:pyridoxal phosphate-dependent decarboxylase family protein n=1 Tax=Vibrio cholerae TaxID=666 RepID=UPI003F58D0F8
MWAPQALPNHGAIDDLVTIADVAEKHALWMHVDSAYGGALILSSRKDCLDGIERAQSISVDFHKLFFQTISCGALLLKDKHNFKYLLHHADYLNREHDTLPNLVDKSISTTKRFDALKVFMTMQNVGLNNWAPCTITCSLKHCRWRNWYASIKASSF